MVVVEARGSGMTWTMDRRLRDIYECGARYREGHCVVWNGAHSLADTSI